MATHASKKRPVTQAKDIVESVEITVVAGIPTYNFTPEQRNKLWQLLHIMDASTGKPDAARKARPSRRSRGSSGATTPTKRAR